MQPKRISRADVLAVTIALLLLSSLVFGQLADNRELANRSVCAANLRGITQSMNVYAADGDIYPLLTPPASATSYSVAFKEDASTKGPDEALLSLYKEKKYPDNPSASLWIMVMTGQVAPKQFICRSDLLATPAVAAKGEGFYLNFQSPRNVSYSSAYPWTERNGKVAMGGLWHNDTDAGLPIISDMAPYFGRTAADFKEPAPLTPTPEQRTINDRLMRDLTSPDFATRDIATKELTLKGPDAFPGLREAVTASTDAELRSRALPILLAPSHTQQWVVTKANSSIHNLDGQNVGFGDGHAEFFRNPAAGEDNDSIWGIIKDPAVSRIEVPIAAGALPHAPTGSRGNWDVVMVPTRDEAGNLK